VDSRLSRLETVDVGNEQERLQRHRRIIQEASVLIEEENNGSVPSEAPVKSQDEELTNQVSSLTIRGTNEPMDDIEKRRLKARQNAQASDDEVVAEELPLEPDDEQENENESSSVSDSEGEEEPEQWDQFTRAPRLQPRFVKKEKRQTVAEKEQIQKEEERLKEEKDKQIKERKERTRILLKEAIERDKSTKIVEEEIVITDDDDDEETQQKEYEIWKLRELVRIRRERDDREKWRLERIEVERRRTLTDEELIN